MLRTQLLFVFTLVLCACLAVITPVPVQAQAIKVELRQTADGWQLLRDGKPYRVRGAGGNQYLELLKESGGNSIRTWGVGNDTKDILDAAHAQGLSVTVGIWLGHERHGFNYSNMDQVTEQFANVRKAVLEFKDHPAVLAWGIGNEMEGFEAGDNAAIWSHLEACAALVKSLDPDHPTMTTIAEIGGRKVEAIHKLCPSIDIVGINSYGGVQSIPDRYKQAGGTKPYIVTEYGPAGTWEIGRNSFNAVNELTSTEKGSVYQAVYKKLESDSKQCLGSYAFLWGSKVEATTTWYGMFLSDGSKLAAVDAMTQAWTGKLPADLCPMIESIAVDGDYEQKPGAQVQIKMAAKDPEGKDLKVEWALMLDPLTYETGGDNVAAPPTFPDQIVSSSGTGCTLTLPNDGGIYRVFVVVRDPKGNAAVANLPLYAGGAADGVPGQPAGQQAKGMTPGKPGELPFVVYTESDGPAPWIASGYMGNGGGVAMDPNFTVNPHGGKSCLRVEYRAGDQWAGVVWQDPANDWGDAAGGYDLKGATALEFWARGDKGGEAVNFGFGLLGADSKYPDSGKGEIKDIRLTDQWRKYRIEIGSNTDMQRIKTGFYWTLGGQGSPVTFYLDDIRFVKDAAE